MTTPEFVVRLAPRFPVRLEKSYSATYVEETKPGKPVGIFQTRVGTGKFDRHQVTILAGNYAPRVPLTADAIKSKIRRVRPQERERLDAIDEQIKELGRQRVAIINEAFAKGHVVTLAEVKAKADAALSRRKERTQ